MNILVEPVFNQFYQALISFLIIIGTSNFGKYVNNLFFKINNNFFLNLILGLIVISQVLYIGILINFFKIFLYILIILIFISLILYFLDLKKISIYKIINKSLNLNILSLIFLFSIFLISIGPPTMADALDYHYGIPQYILNFGKLPESYFWLHGNLGGIGEIFNTIGLTLFTDNLVSTLQFICFFTFLLEVTKKSNLDTKNLIFLFVLSSPVLIFLLSGPKFQLLPILINAYALYLICENKSISLNKFLLIAFLLISAFQFRLTFVLSSSVLFFYLIYKSKELNPKIYYYLPIIIIFLVFPKFFWNFLQNTDNNFYNYITTLPEEFSKKLSEFRENNLIFPLNLIIPKSLGQISTLLGFQFLIIFFIKKEKKLFKEFFIIVFIASILHYFLGVSISRTYYEFIIWFSIIFIITNTRVSKNLYLFIKLHLFSNIFIAIFFLASISPSFFSLKKRDEIMKKITHHYNGINYINDRISEEKIILSGLRSVALYKNEFIPTDSIKYYMPKSKIEKYFNLIKEKKPDYYVIENDLINKSLFKNCLGKKILLSPKFNKEFRNLFNRKMEYFVAVYEFQNNKFPDCLNF